MPFAFSCKVTPSFDFYSVIVILSSILAPLNTIVSSFSSILLINIGVTISKNTIMGIAIVVTIFPILAII